MGGVLNEGYRLESNGTKGRGDCFRIALWIRQSGGIPVSRVADDQRDATALNATSRWRESGSGWRRNGGGACCPRRSIGNNGQRRPGIDGGELRGGGFLRRLVNVDFRQPVVRRQSLLEFDASACQVAHFLISETPAGEGRNELRLHLQGVLVVDQRARQVASVSQRVAALDIGEGNLRVGPDRLVLIGQRAIKITLQSPHLAAVADAKRDA